MLIDAPCSGLGTLKRNPEIKWNLTSNQLTELQQTQKQLLQQATTTSPKKKGNHLCDLLYSARRKPPTNCMVFDSISLNINLKKKIRS